VPDGGFHVASAFNDSSLHVFPAAACAAFFGSGAVAGAEPGDAAMG
jgi:hypothetical protein